MSTKNNVRFFYDYIIERISLYFGLINVFVNCLVVLIDKDFVVSHSDSKTLAEDKSSDASAYCKEQAMNKITSGVNSEDMHEIINSMSTCFVQQITPKIEELRDEIQLQASIRTDLALKWENYTCADLDAKPSESIENITWTYNEDRKRRKVQKLFDRDASKVYTVKNFISFEECKAMETEAAKTLHEATVADGSGGSHVVESRKAKHNTSHF